MGSAGYRDREEPGPGGPHGGHEGKEGLGPGVPPGAEVPESTDGLGRGGWGEGVPHRRSFGLTNSSLLHNGVVVRYGSNFLGDGWSARDSL